MWRPLFLVASLLTADASRAPAPPVTVRVVRFEVERPADGKRYPLPVKESYSIKRDGVLRYGAYFGGMPMHLNHNDSVEWPAGEAGKKLLATALALHAEPAAGLAELPDSEPTELPGAGVFHVGFSLAKKGDVTHRVKDPAAPAYRRLRAAFEAMRAQFEQATGRPLDPGKLPQGR